MELIKIIFFVIGTFFGNENSRIAAEKTIVTIDNSEMTMTINQKHLISVIKTKEDSLTVVKELALIVNKENTWTQELDKFSSKKYELYQTKNGNLNAIITLAFNQKEDLKDFALETLNNGSYSLIYIPRWNLTSSNGKVEGNYWHFENTNTITFELEPFKDIPKEYKDYIKSLAPMWQSINQQ